MPPNSYRTPKRIYTHKALESWFERLSSTWEHHFSDSVLKSARELYREGEIRELELSPIDAIIHCGRGKLGLYSTIEWENGHPNVRTSTKDRHFGRCLAAAGLYEIEELVGDEILPVPCEELDSDSGKQTPQRLLESDAGESTPTENIRDLVVKFRSSEQGLVFEAHWQKHGEKSIQALSRHKRRGGNLNLGEREKLIRLTGLARQCGFEYSSRQGRFLLRDPHRISSYFKKNLPLWKNRFRVEMDNSAVLLLKGVQTVKVEAAADVDNGVFSLRWILKLDKRIVDHSLAEKLLGRRGNTVILPGYGMVRVDRVQAPILEDWRALQLRQKNGCLPTYILFSLFGQNSLPVKMSAVLKKWRDSVLQPISSVNGLPDILRPYQRQGVRWLANLCDKDCHALLADEMGLGKTLQVAALMVCRPLPGKRHLVVCPASVVPVWKNELARYFPQLRVEILRRGHNFINYPEPVIWLTSYTQLRRQKNLLAQTDFGYAVLDEAQLIKNPDAKVSLACMGIAARHRLILTGTPLENRHLDLWTLFRFLMPGLLGERQSFCDGLERDGADFLKRLSRQITPFVLRRTKKNVARELPPKVEIPMVCPLSGLQEQEYSRLVEEGLSTLGNDFSQIKRQRTMNLFTLLTRLRQTCCDPDLLPWLSAGLSQSGKLNILQTKVAEGVSNNHKIVIFSQFVSLLNRVKESLEINLPEIPVYTLTGRTIDRDKPVSGFQTTKGAGIILISLRAGGTGITLHAADDVFLLDPWWNPAVEEQAIDRVHRIGQKKPVFVYRMITEGTIEERMEELKAAKRDLFNQVVGDLKDVSHLEDHFSSLSELITLKPSGQPKN